MQDELKPIEETEFEDAFALIPEEIQDFMWSDEFEFLLDTAQKTLSLTDPEKQLMRTVCYRILLNLRSMEQEAKRVLAEGTDPEKALKMFYIIDTEILERARNILAETEDEELESEENETNIKAPSPSDMITRLNQSLTGATTITPTKREYGNISNSDGHKKDSGVTIDPYREIPEA